MKYNFVSIYISCVVVCFTHAFLQVESEHHQNSCFPRYIPNTSHTTWTMMQKSFSVQFLRNSKSLQIILHVHNEMRFALSAMPGSRQQQRCQRAETMFDCKKKLLLQNASTPDCLNRVHSTVRLLAELVEEQFRFSPNSLLRSSS